jgi:hypothetical protein
MQFSDPQPEGYKPFDKPAAFVEKSEFLALIKSLEDFHLFTDVLLPAVGDVSPDIIRAVLDIMQTCSLTHPLEAGLPTAEGPAMYCWVPVGVGRQQISNKHYLTLICNEVYVNTGDYAQFVKPFAVGTGTSPTKLTSPDASRPLIMLGKNLCNVVWWPVDFSLGFNQSNPRAPLTPLQDITRAHDIALPSNHQQPHECFGPLLLSSTEGTGQHTFSTLNCDCSHFIGCPPSTTTEGNYEHRVTEIIPVTSPVADVLNTLHSNSQEPGHLQGTNTGDTEHLQTFTALWGRLKRILPAQAADISSEEATPHTRDKDTQDDMLPPALPVYVLNNYEAVNGEQITRWLDNIAEIGGPQSRVQFSGDSLDAVARSLADAMYWLTDKEPSLAFRPSQPHAALMSSFDFVGINSFLRPNRTFIAYESFVNSC